MKEEKLKELLERYYNGDTSQDEEFLLKKYFCGSDTLPGYDAEREIFRYFSCDEEVIKPSDDLESRILKSIDVLKTKQKHELHYRRRLVILSMAASLLVLIGSYFFFIHETEPEDTFDDPQIAYAEAKQILYDVSDRLSRGTLVLQHVARTTQAGLESVEKSAKLLSDQIEIVEHPGKFLEKRDQKK